MKNKTGRIVVIGIVVAWIAAAVQISNKNAYQKVIAQQKMDIALAQSGLDGCKEMIKNYEKSPEHPEYQNAIEWLPRHEARLETITPIYEANVEYYNTHWLLLRRPIIY